MKPSLAPLSDLLLEFGGFDLSRASVDFTKSCQATNITAHASAFILGLQQSLCVDGNR